MTELSQVSTAVYDAQMRDNMSAAADKAAASVEVLARAIENTSAQSVRMDTSFKQLEARLDSGARLAQAKARADETLARQTQTLAIALERGQIAQDRYNELLGAAGQRRADYIAGVERQILAERNKVQALREAEEATRRALETEQRVAAHVARMRSEEAAARNAQAAQTFYGRPAGVTAPMGEQDRAARAADIEAYGRKLDELRAKYVPLAAAELARQRQLEGIAEAERLGAITAREAATARATLAAATQQNAAALRDFSNTTASTTANTRDFRGALQQVGYQTGDLFTQISMGQNGLLAFGVQASQLVSFFGPAGARAGAGIVIAVVVAQMLGLADASKALNDAIKAQDELYRAATEAAERYRAGLQQEAETITGLTGLYSSYSDARRRAEEFRLLDRQGDLEREQRNLARRASQIEGLDSLPGLLANVANMNAARAARGQGGAEISQQLREAAAAVLELRAQGTASSEALARYAMVLQDAAAIAADALAPALLKAARGARDLIPEAETAEQSMRRNALQQEAFARSTNGATLALQGAARAAGQLSGELRRVLEIAAANPALAVQQQAAAIEQRLDALRTGGLPALERETRAQEDNERVNRALTQAYADQMKRLEELRVPQEQRHALAMQAAADVGLETMRLNERNATLEAERKAREEAGRAAERAGRESEQRAERERREAHQREERQRREFEQQEERVRREAERDAEQNARRFDRRAEQWGDSLADATFRGLEEGAGRGMGFFESLAATFGSLLRRAAASGLSNLVFQPLASSALRSIGYTGAESGPGSMWGSVSNLLGLRNLFPGGGSGILDSLGLGRVGSTVSGWLSTPLWGGGGLSAGALSGPGGLAALEASGLGAASLGPTLGSLLGGVGGGFTAGSLLSSLIASSPARQTNGQIGSGAGALAGAVIGSIIPGIGTVLGGLIGGAAGGGLGGLFGNSGRGFSGGDALIGRDNAGGLVFSGFAGKGFDGSELTQQAQQEIAAFNARLAQAGVFVNSGMRASIGGGESSAPRTLAGALDRYGFGLGSNDPRIAQAMAPYAGNIEGALAIAEEAKAVADALDALKAPSDSFAASMKALDDQFRPLWESTVKLGFGFEEVNVAWTQAQRDLTAQRDRSLLGITEGLRIRGLRAGGLDTEASLAEFDFRAVDEFKALEAQLKALGMEASFSAGILENLRDVQARERAELALGGNTLRSLGADINQYLERLRTTQAGAYSIPEQLAAARTIFDRSLAAAQLNDPAALGRITGDADALLGAARGMYASGQGFTAIRDYVTTTLAELEAARVARAANQPEPATGADIEELLAGVMASDAETRAELAQVRALLADIAATNRTMLNREAPTPVGARG